MLFAPLQNIQLFINAVAIVLRGRADEFLPYIRMLLIYSE
jgi:hypothetical protein